MSAHVLAIGAVSPFGLGEDAYHLGRVNESARIAIGPDLAFARAGVSRPIAARVEQAGDERADRAASLLKLAFDRCVRELDGIAPQWRAQRVGLAVGTSSGGMSTTEHFLASLAQKGRVGRSMARGATYFTPLDLASADAGVSFSPRVTVLGACASSTLAIGLALRWLQLGRCDLVLAGGFDALTTFVVAGFDALRATTSTLPRPFRLGRDGMALGEGAAIVALAKTPAGDPHRRSSCVAGFGASTDAVHLTAPDRTGSGLGRAAALALADAGLTGADIDLVSAHATATPFNDTAEAKAMVHALGDLSRTVVHPMKAQIGHTLGAAGVLESLGAFDALARGIGPAAAGEGDLDPQCPLRLLEKNEQLRGRAALKLSSAFGGCNAALVLTPRPPVSTSARVRPVFLRGFGAIAAPLDTQSLREALQGRHPHLHRLDRLAKLVLSAAYSMVKAGGGDVLCHAGVIVGHTLATLEQNDLFATRLRELGPRFVEPRRFPATSPNACAGECAIAFHLTGPSFAVGGSLHGGLEALAVARDLVASGDAPAMLVVAVDLAGPASSALLQAAEAGPIDEGACAAVLAAEPGIEGRPLDDEIPMTLTDRSDWLWTAPYGHRELRTYLANLGKAPKQR